MAGYRVNAFTYVCVCVYVHVRSSVFIYIKNIHSFIFWNFQSSLTQEFNKTNNTSWKFLRDMSYNITEVIFIYWFPYDRKCITSTDSVANLL
jgi:hypothetical protein